MNREPIFTAVRKILGRGVTQAEVMELDAAIDAAGGVAAAATPARKTSKKGRDLIALFEGLRLQAYPDPATGGAPWTIGVGHTGPEVKPGLVITAAQADAYLSSDLGRFEKAVVKLAPVASQDQFDAIVSLAFNVGEGNLASSTLLKKHNAGDHDGAAMEFAKWNKAAGRVMAGLTRRRAAEATLYRGQA